MLVYITRSYEPMGGFYSGSSERVLGVFADEIRLVEDFPDTLWDDIMRGGVTMGLDGTLDTIWYPYYEQGTTVWRRE